MNTELRALVDLRDRTLQKARIMFSNRVSAIERGSDQSSERSLKRFTKWFEMFKGLEDEADQDIAAMVEDIPIVGLMRQVKGIGPLLAAKVISMIDIERANSVSAL